MMLDQYFVLRLVPIILGLVLNFYAMAALACPGPTPIQEEELKFDYRSYMRNPQAAQFSKHVDISSSKDFIKTYPEGDLKQKTITELHMIVPEGVYLASIDYIPETSMLELHTISWGCSRISSIMRMVGESDMFEKPHLESVVSLESNEPGVWAVIQIFLKNNG